MIAMDWATESDTGTGSEMLAAAGSQQAAVVFSVEVSFPRARRLLPALPQEMPVLSEPPIFDSVASRQCCGWAPPFSLPGAGDVCWYFFRSRHLLGYRRSVLLGRSCDSLRALIRLFLFRLLNLNHLAGLKLIRKIRRSRLLCSRQVRTGEANTSAHNDDAPVRAGMAKMSSPSQERQITSVLEQFAG